MVFKKIAKKVCFVIMSVVSKVFLCNEKKKKKGRRKERNEDQRLFKPLVIFGSWICWCWVFLHNKKFFPHSKQAVHL